MHNTHPEQQQNLQQNMNQTVEMDALRLMTQAETIQKLTGTDVLKLFNEQEEIKQRVLSREWDMVDVYRNAVQQQPEEPSVPAVVRSAGPAPETHPQVAQMTDAQFEQLNRSLAKGHVVKL